MYYVCLSSLFIILTIGYVYSELSGCFDILRSRRLDCVTPVIRRSPVTESDCRTLCLTNPADCHSINYNYYQKTCELLDVSVGIISERKTTRRLYKRETKCASTRLVRAIGISYLIPKEECLIPKDLSQIRLSPIAQPVITVSTPIDNDSAPKDPFADVLMLPIVPDCPIGERARVQIIDGVSVDFAATVSFTVPMAAKCIEACRMSTYPTGNRLPLLCRSAVFDTRTGRCSVYPDALNPNGYLEYRPDNLSIYMEKLCFPDTVLPLSCDEIFRRVPQHILLGHAAEIITSSSLTECVKECIVAKMRKLDCHSLMYYMDIPFNNCILNIHSRHSRPEYYMPELRYKVDYVEVPACALVEQQIDATPDHIPTHAVMPSTDDTKYAIALDKLKKVQLNEGKGSVEFEWTPWSSCRNGLRQRERMCSDCKETLQSEPCIPNENNEFNKALQKFVADQETQGRVVDKSQTAMSDEKAGFLSKPSPIKIIPFPDKNEENSTPVKSENIEKGVEFFGPPLKTEQEPKGRLFYY